MKNKNIIDIYENQAELLMELLSELEIELNKYFVGKRVTLIEDMDEDEYGVGVISTVELCDEILYFGVDFPDNDFIDNLEKDEIVFVED